MRRNIEQTSHTFRFDNCSCVRPASRSKPPSAAISAFVAPTKMGPNEDVDERSMENVRKEPTPAISHAATASNGIQTRFTSANVSIVYVRNIHLHFFLVSADKSDWNGSG